MLRLSLDTTLCNINTKPVPIGQQIRKIDKEESCRSHTVMFWSSLTNFMKHCVLQTLFDISKDGRSFA